MKSVGFLSDGGKIISLSTREDYAEKFSLPDVPHVTISIGEEQITIPVASLDSMLEQLFSLEEENV